MEDFSKSINALYGNRQKFIVIGLTGRTGSGCTSAAKILSSEIKNIKLPKPKLTDDNEERKYKIVYEFAKKNWLPFALIQIKDVITSFVLEESYDSFLEYVSSKLDSISCNFIKEKLDSEIKASYEKLHDLRIQIKKLRKENEEAELISKKKIEERREKSFNFYFKAVPPFTEKLKTVLSKLSEESYTKMYQTFGDNIRSSGKAFIEEFDSKNIYRLAVRVNKLIKIFTKNAKPSKREVFIVIDAIRNPFEATFFRERYSAFYLMSINSKNSDRVFRLQKYAKLNDEQIGIIDKKELCSQIVVGI